TQQAGEQLPKQKLGRQLFSALASFCGLALVMLQLSQHVFTETGNQPIEPNVSNIGNQMLGINDNGYALPFELVSMLLLAALIGCIVIALKTKPETNIEQGTRNNEL
ncbi:MAG TPA: NADH-quinone oxidoreductase subunit J, partial [Ferruginibacter sp.]|nr:NADH-quinone oxidoreductase subunit J [Ferruginibacter sp.]